MKSVLKTYNIIYSQISKSISDNPGYIFPLISGFLVVVIVRAFLSLLDTAFAVDEFPFQRIIFMLSTGLLIMGMEIGYTKLIFEKIDLKNRSLSYIFSHFHVMGKYLKGLIIFYFAVLIFCIPGILFCIYKYGFEFFGVTIGMVFDPYFQELATSFYDFNELAMIVAFFAILPAYIMIRLYFWSYFIIDKNLDGLQAIANSWKITQNRNLEIVVFSICILLFNFIGILTIVGMCITAPLSYLFLCLYFRHLASK